MVEKCKLSGNPLERASRPSVGGWMAERLTRLPTSKNPLEIYRRSFPLLNSEEKKLPANPGAERATSTHATEQPPPPRCSGPHPPTCATTHLTSRLHTHTLRPEVVQKAEPTEHATAASRRLFRGVEHAPPRSRSAEYIYNIYKIHMYIYICGPRNRKMAANLFCKRGVGGLKWGMKRAGARDEGEGDQGERPPSGGATGEERGGGCGESGEARKRRVCAEFVSRVDRSRVIGHSLFLRRDYARSIYRLYSIDYTNLSSFRPLHFSHAPVFDPIPTRSRCWAFGNFALPIWREGEGGGG